MATHASILAWEIAWTEEPGEPQSIGSQESDTAEHTHPPPSGVIFSPQQSVTPSKHNSPCNTSQTVFLTVLGTLPCLHFSSLSLRPHLLHSSSATHQPTCCLSDIPSILPSEELFSCYFQCQHVLPPDFIISSSYSTQSFPDQTGLSLKQHLSHHAQSLSPAFSLLLFPNTYVHSSLHGHSISSSTGR